MAEYIKQEMSDLDGSGEQRVFYRMKTYHNINAREFVSKLARPGSGLSEGKETDTLDGDEQKRNARSIMVNGVNFRASKDLIKETARHCELKRAGVSRIHHSPYSPEERITLALKYLDENHFMRVADYMKLTGLRKTSATLELKRLREDPANGITTEGKRNGMIYVKRNNK